MRNEKTVCPSCGSECVMSMCSLEEMNPHFEEYVCMDCGVMFKNLIDFGAVDKIKEHLFHSFDTIVKFFLGMKFKDSNNAVHVYSHNMGRMYGIICNAEIKWVSGDFNKGEDEKEPELRYGEFIMSQIEEQRMTPYLRYGVDITYYRDGVNKDHRDKISAHDELTAEFFQTFKCFMMSESRSERIYNDMIIKWVSCIIRNQDKMSGSSDHRYTTDGGNWYRD